MRQRGHHIAVLKLDWQKMKLTTIILTLIEQTEEQTTPPHFFKMRRSSHGPIPTAMAGGGLNRKNYWRFPKDGSCKGYLGCEF